MYTPSKHQQVPRKVTRMRRVVQAARWVEKISRVVLLGLIASAAVYGVGYVLYFGDVFEVEQVMIHGDLKMTSEASLRTWARIPEHTNMFRMSMRELEQRLVAYPWVKSVAVRRKLPHAIWMYVVEREPFALVQANGTLYVADAQGDIFKPLTTGDPTDLPIFSGITDLAIDARGVGHSSQLERLISAYQLVADHPIAGHVGISEIMHDQFGRIAVVTEQPTMYLRLGETPSAEQFDRLLAILPALQRDGIDGAHIDLYVERKIVVRNRTGRDLVGTGSPTRGEHG